MRRLLAIFAAAATAGAIAVGAAVSPATRACAGGWRVVAESNAWKLEDVAALSADDVWAVGYAGPESAQRPRIARWNGHKLTVVAGFRALRSGRLAGVAAVSRNDVWAVGSDDRSPGDSRPVVEHWNGTTWRVVPTPSLDASAGLYDVTSVSRDDVWAVGKVGTRPLYEHWDANLACLPRQARRLAVRRRRRGRRRPLGGRTPSAASTSCRRTSWGRRRAGLQPSADRALERKGLADAANLLREHPRNPHRSLRRLADRGLGGGRLPARPLLLRLAQIARASPTREWTPSLR